MLDVFAFLVHKLPHTLSFGGASLLAVQSVVLQDYTQPPSTPSTQCNLEGAASVRMKKQIMVSFSPNPARKSIACSQRVWSRLLLHLCLSFAWFFHLLSTNAGVVGTSWSELIYCGVAVCGCSFSRVDLMWCLGASCTWLRIGIWQH